MSCAVLLIRRFTVTSVCSVHVFRSMTPWNIFVIWTISKSARFKMQFLTRMHSSAMHTTCSLLYMEVSVQGGLCPGGGLCSGTPLSGDPLPKKHGTRDRVPPRRGGSNNNYHNSYFTSTDYLK